MVLNVETSFEGQFGGAFYEIPNIGFCKAGNKKSPCQRLKGAKKSGILLAELNVVAVDGLEVIAH